MKLILTSADLLLDCKSTHDCDNTIEVLEKLTSIDCVIVFTSSHQKKLDKLPDSFHTLLITRKFKMGTEGLIEKVLEKTKFESPQDIIVLGANDSDCIMAFNHKLLLFTARWLSENKNNKKIFQYGIGLGTPDSLTLLIDNFLDMSENPWYYNVNVSNITTMHSLVSANTYGKTGSGVELANTFKKHLKEGETGNRIHLLAYFMVSCHYNLEELRGVNYVGIYPSSSSTDNPDLEYFKETLRVQHKIRFKEPLLIRHTSVSKRHLENKNDRIQNGATSQFDSIRINPKLKGKLKGTKVCIIDDFTTYGTSCETVRHLFEYKKVQSLIFLTLGKFGRSYYKYDYEISGNIYDTYTYKQINSHTEITGTFNSSDSAKELVKRLGHILK